MVSDTNVELKMTNNVQDCIEMYAHEILLLEVVVLLMRWLRAVACKRADLGLLVQFRGFPLDLLLVIAIKALDVVNCGFQVLHGYATLYLSEKSKWSEEDVCMMLYIKCLLSNYQHNRTALYECDMTTGSADVNSVGVK